MSEIRLLASPVDMPPDSEVNSESTSLVRTTTQAVKLTSVTRTSTRTDTAYLDDDYVWSLSEGNERVGFNAVPLEQSRNGRSSDRENDFLSASVSDSQWSSLNNCYAVCQYALFARMPMPIYGHRLDVYA